MLRRHLASLGAGRSHEPWRTEDAASLAATADAQQGDLACRLREALPRLWDEAMRRDLAEVLRMMERDHQQRHTHSGSV